MTTQSSSRSLFDIFNKMTKRFELKKKIQITNKKTYARALPWQQRFVYQIFNHKKKLIFFTLCGCAIYYYGYHQKIAKWVRNIQPINDKIDRWFLGKRNKIPGGILKQQDISDIKLSDSSKQRLLQQYIKLDKQLKMGVGRGALYNIFDQYGLMWDEKRKQQYWRQTGYYRQRNQKVAGSTPKQFLQLIQFSINQLKTSNPDLNEYQLVSDFLLKLRQQIPKVKQTQSQLIHQRQVEYKKIMKDEFKQQYINQLMAKDTNINPLLTDDFLKNNGLNGLSIKDHYQLVTLKLVEMTLLKNHVEKKMASIYKKHKTQKYKNQFEQYQKQIKALLDKQNQLEIEFKRYYQTDIY